MLALHFRHTCKVELGSLAAAVADVALERIEVNLLAGELLLCFKLFSQNCLLGLVGQILLAVALLLKLDLLALLGHTLLVDGFGVLY